MTDVDKIAAYYDEKVLEEYRRLTISPLHEAEFVLTTDLLQEYIRPNTHVLDVGSGPGKYAEYLIQAQDCQVGLVDISEKALEEFKTRILPNQRKNVLFTTKASATNLDFLPDCSFDHVLLMGPLYHLLEEQERERSLTECNRALKTGGMIFASYISPYIVIPRFLNEAFSLIENNEIVSKVVNQGLIESPLLSGFIDHYRCWPSQAKATMEIAGFETIRLRNLEGVGMFFRDQQKQALAEQNKKEAWFNILRQTCENPDLLGATIHFLYVGRKL